TPTRPDVDTGARGPGRGDPRRGTHGSRSRPGDAVRGYGQAAHGAPPAQPAASVRPDWETARGVARPYLSGPLGTAATGLRFHFGRCTTMSIGEAQFHATMKAYIDASEHFSDVSTARFVVLNDPTRPAGDVDEIAQSHEEATRELFHCLERVHVMLDELEARPWREAAETDERAKLAEWRSMAEAEARGERGE